MNPQVFVLGQVFAVILLFLTSVLALSFVAKLVFYRPRPRLEPPAVDDSRLRRLEEGMDAIAIEIERMSESQRFTAKLLAAKAAEKEGAGTE